VEQAKEFFDAIQSGNLEAVKTLLAAHAGLAAANNEQGQSAVLFAVYNRKPEILKLLLAQGVALELHEAAAAGQLESVKRIVEREPALAKSYSPDGFPVFALAAVFGHKDVAEYLFAKGAEVNAAAKNPSGYNALTGAVASGHAELVKWLLANGADANYRYGAGYSPLLTAAANGHLEILKTLVAHGADLRATTNDGKSALQFAEERGHNEVAAFLKAQRPA
jgi:uncharacterized protein